MRFSFALHKPPGLQTTGRQDDKNRLIQGMFVFWAEISKNRAKERTAIKSILIFTSIDFLTS
jgi:hypothetical protein